jgi:hypothetical protein
MGSVARPIAGASLMPSPTIATWLYSRTSDSMTSTLSAGSAYRVTDYVDGKDLGTVRGPVATLDVIFDKHLLLEAKPE